jgi:hypothetical protein
MALVSSGEISIGGSTSGRSINLELGKAATATSSLNDADLRSLAGISTGAISLSSFYGKSSVSYFLKLFGDNYEQKLKSGSTHLSSGNVYLSGTSYESSISKWGLYLAKINADANIIWQKCLINSSFNIGDVAHNTITDSSGNFYASCPAQPNALLVKYDANGVLQWQRFLGGGNSTTIYKIQLDSSGNIYVSGTHYDTSWNLMIFIAKFNSSGVIQWQKTVNAYQYSGNSLTVDSSGNVYICAQFNYSVLTIKLDTNGTLLWQHTLGGDSYEAANDITVDSVGNVYVSASTAQYSASLIIKYNSSGVLQWQKTYSLHLYAQIRTDSSNNFYLFAPYTQSSHYQNRIAIVKYDSSGVLQWQRYFQPQFSTSSSRGVYPGSMSLDASGSFYCIFEATAKVTSNSNDNDIRSFVLKLPVDGSKTGYYEVYGIFPYCNFMYTSLSNTDATATLSQDNTGTATISDTTTLVVSTPSFTESARSQSFTTIQQL